MVLFFVLIAKVMNSSITQQMSFQSQSDMEKKNIVMKIDVVFLTKLGRKSSTRAPFKSRLWTGAENGTWIVVFFFYIVENDVCGLGSLFNNLVSSNLG